MYCFGEGIIQGTRAPEGGNPGRFSPTDNITLQQAVAMLVRALGYTEANAMEISWERVLPHATSDRVRLLGRNVETDGFDLVELGRRASDQLTRNDMGMLLYNFLLSEYYDFGPAFDRNLNRWINVVQMTDVLNSFGIDRQFGYITAVQNYAVRLDVKDYYVRADNNQRISWTFQGTPITVRQANPLAGTTVVNPYDIQISYAEARYNGETYAGLDTREIRTTFETLGWDKPDTVVEQRMLLGRKVSVFRHTDTRAAARGQSIPASVLVGNIEPVNNSENKSAFTPESHGDVNLRVRAQRVKDVQDLTLGTGGNGVLSFNQRGGFRDKDLNLRYNLYAFTREGFLVSDSGNKNHTRNVDVEWNDAGAVGTVTSMIPDVLGEGSDAARRANFDNLVSFDNYWFQGISSGSKLDIDEDSIEKQLAKMIGTDDSHYELYYVDNGLTRNGTPEFFYVFIPYRAAIVEEPATPSFTGRVDLDGREHRFERFANYATGGDTTNAAVLYTIDDNLAITAGAGDMSIVRDDAFLYTSFGAEYRDVVIKEKLIIASRDNVITRLVGSTVTFTGQTIAQTVFDLARTGLAVNAWQASNFPTGNNGVTVGNGMDVYTDANDNVIFLKQPRINPTRATPNREAWRYGVTLSAGHVVLHPTQLIEGRQATIFDAGNNRNTQMFFTNVDGDGAPTFAEEGHFIAFRPYREGIMEVVIISNLLDGNRESVSESLLDSPTPARHGVWGVAPSGPLYRGDAFTTFTDANNPAWVVGNRLTIPRRDAANPATGTLTNLETNATLTNAQIGIRNSAFISDDTLIIAAKWNTLLSGEPAVETQVFNRNSLPAHSGGAIMGAGFIAEGNGETVRNASVVMVVTNAAFNLAPTEVSERYAVILSNVSAESEFEGGFRTRRAFIYATGQTIDVYGPDAALDPGVVVVVGAVNDNGYYRVSPVGTSTTSQDRINSRVMFNTGANNTAEQVIDALKDALLASPTQLATPTDGNALNTVVGRLDWYTENQGIGIRTGQSLNASATEFNNPAMASASLTVLTLAQDATHVRTIFVGQRATGFEPGNPHSWTTENAQIRHRPDTLWHFRTPDTNAWGVPAANTFVVATTDRENRVIALTMIVAGVLPTGGSGSFDWQGQNWR
jgi:hypothetical protein